MRSWSEAIAWRSQAAGPVVFTNGVFDLLHPGHVELLESARREGGSLVVAVNSDHSSRALAKGPGRPVVDESSRARVVAALAAVDCVVLFDEPTPLRLIEAIRPDVLVKGGDYHADQVVGAEQVRALGGRVVIVPLMGGHSSTRIVEKTRGST